MCRSIFFEQSTKTNTGVLKTATGLLDDPLFADVHGIIPVAKLDSLAYQIAGHNPDSPCPNLTLIRKGIICGHKGGEYRRAGVPLHPDVCHIAHHNPFYRQVPHILSSVDEQSSSGNAKQNLLRLVTTISSSSSSSSSSASALSAASTLQTFADRAVIAGITDAPTPSGLLSPSNAHSRKRAPPAAAQIVFHPYIEAAIIYFNVKDPLE
jgi:hypothetical protein